MSKRVIQTFLTAFEFQSLTIILLACFADFLAICCFFGFALFSIAFRIFFALFLDIFIGLIEML